MTLANIRNQWEGILTPLCVIDQQESRGQTLVILSNDIGEIFCHRYFAIGPIFACSTDERAVTAVQAFEWIAKHASDK